MTAQVPPRVAAMGRPFHLPCAAPAKRCTRAVWQEGLRAALRQRGAVPRPVELGLRQLNDGRQPFHDIRTSRSIHDAAAAHSESDLSHKADIHGAVLATIDAAICTEVGEAQIVTFAKFG